MKLKKSIKIYLSLIAFVIMQTYIYGQTTALYDFNTAGQLSSNFNGVGNTSNVTQNTSNGLSGSGGIAVPTGVTNATFATKSGYSMGPVGSTYVFSSYIKSDGMSGFGGMGFTTSSPAVSSIISSGFNSVYRPNDALGIDVHGAGFVFHNGNTSYEGYWESGGPGITTVKPSTGFIIDNGSPSKWFKIILTVRRMSASTFNMRVEVWPSDANGVLLNSTASTIHELNGVTNSAMVNAPIIHSYFNFSGDRLRAFDNYQINLSGGITIIDPGKPVVLTTSATQNIGIVSLTGNVTSENGSIVTERGFVYATTSSPTTANTKIISGSGLGVFNGQTPILPGGTYYFRAYATNANGTSYGAEFPITITYIDSDGDGIPDINDIDSDNDGILDAYEFGNCGNVNDPDIENPSVATFGWDAFFDAFNSGTNWTQATFTPGYFSNTAAPGNGAPFNGLTLINPIPTPSGNRYSGLHTNFDNGVPGTPKTFESISNNLATPLVGGTKYSFRSLAFAMILNTPSFNQNNARIQLYGIATGAPTPNYATAAYPSELGNLPNVYYLGQTSVISNTASWQEFFVTFVAPVNIDRIIISANGYNSFVGFDGVQIRCGEQDTDGDGVPDYLDLDSDNDGCVDAIEGGADIANTSLVNSGGTVTVGPGSTAFNQNLCATNACVNAQGLPQLAQLPTGYSNITGQAIGSSQNAAINSCICYNLPTVGTGVNTRYGITLLQRAGANNGNWPMIRKSAHMVLESNTKGFVITRMNTTQITNIPSPQEGMMVYDTVAKCLKLYDGTAWNCFETPTCP